jgi:TetR/AcrR family transcriptional repressor of nem operon
MRVSGKKVAEHRAALLETAKRLLQERGFAGAGVIDISREAGLTQGALYGQFGSKDGLAAEAVRQAFAEGATAWRELCENDPDPFAAYIDAYLSELHLTDVGSGCMLAACLSEVRRQDPAIGAAFTEGVSTMADFMQQALPPSLAPEDARRRALAALSGLVGSVALARAVAPTDPELAREILAAARDELRQGATR